MNVKEERRIEGRDGVPVRVAQKAVTDEREQAVPATAVAQIKISRVRIVVYRWKLCVVLSISINTPDTPILARVRFLRAPLSRGERANTVIIASPVLNEDALPKSAHPVC